jgi:hypothetical protein
MMLITKNIYGNLANTPQTAMAHIRVGVLPIFQSTQIEYHTGLQHLTFNGFPHGNIGQEKRLKNMLPTNTYSSIEKLMNLTLIHLTHLSTLSMYSKHHSFPELQNDTGMIEKMFGQWRFGLM